VIISLIAVVSIIAAIAVVAAHPGVVDTLFQPANLPLDLVRLIWIEAISRSTMEAMFEALRFVSQPVSAIVTNEVASVECTDLLLETVNPRLEHADLTVTAVVAISVVTIAVRLGGRIILSRGGRGTHSGTGKYK
jgi:hypothetical protein